MVEIFYTALLVLALLAAAWVAGLVVVRLYRGES